MSYFWHQKLGCCAAIRIFDRLPPPWPQIQPALKPERSFVAPIEYSRQSPVLGEISAGPQIAIFRQI